MGGPLAWVDFFRSYTAADRAWAGGRLAAGSGRFDHAAAGLGLPARYRLRPPDAAGHSASNPAVDRYLDGQGWVGRRAEGGWPPLMIGLVRTTKPGGTGEGVAVDLQLGYVTRTYV
jgi:hypothetical protein